MWVDGITWGRNARNEKASEDGKATAEQLAAAADILVAANGADRAAAACERRKLNNVRPGCKPQPSAQSDEAIQE